MKKSLFALALVCATALAVSCCPCRKGTNKNHSPLHTTEWQVVQMNGKNISSLFSAEELPHLTLSADNSFGGFAGCNAMGGKYTLTPSSAPSQKDIAGTIHFENIFSTKRFCPNDQVEMAIIAALSKVDAYTIEGNQLFLFENAELKLVLEAKQQ